MGGSHSFSGIGNLILGGTVWTYADDAAGDCLGWTGSLEVPSGGQRGQSFGLSVMHLN
ncbi:hypothetical protein [Variovorax sp. J31P207]|uniref:hypothetical protein n=1 Tax=Variovorax sp. J31P207 TaxID=3053510 RepID=UPI00257663FB|nr:hypothetical protein [Variovorax sp. J31P207]MDM0072710.1 hypothetical protein [Variovorax sp. J31P207]